MNNAMRTAFAFSLAALTVVGVAAQRPSSEPPSFRTASTDLVVLPVIVTDRQGRFISDLPQDRFSVFDNKKRVDIRLFSRDDAAVSIGLIIDDSGSMRPKLQDVVTAVKALAESSNPDDELFAFAFNDGVRDAVPDRRFLLASEEAALAAALSSLLPQGRTALYDALIAGLDRLEEGSRPRKALVLISDGGDNASRATLEHVLARARESSAAIYTIGIFNEDDLDQNPRVLKELANETGGERFLPRTASSLLDACRLIARELRSAYTIAYEPPDRDGAYHRVRVEVEPGEHRRIAVRTRRGYFAPAAGASH
jgi:Ca-activated chloride channel family protein